MPLLNIKVLYQNVDFTLFLLVLLGLKKEKDIHSRLSYGVPFSLKVNLELVWDNVCTLEICFDNP